MDINQRIQSAFEYYQAGDLKYSEKICRDILINHPDNIDTLYLLSEIYYQKKNYEFSQHYLKKILQINPIDATAYNNIGIVMQEKGEIDEAIICYKKAIKLNQNLADPYNNLGLALKKKCQNEESVAYFQKALVINQNFADAHYNLGNAFREANQLDQSIFHYKKALQINPISADTYYHLGDALREKNYLDEAAYCYQKSLMLNPNITAAYDNLGIIFMKKGQLDEALKHYRRAIELDPDYYSAYNNLGITLQLKGQLDEAILCFQTVLKLNPDSAEAYDNLGNILQEKGRLDEAEVLYKRAIELDPHNLSYAKDLLFQMLYNPRYDAYAIFYEHLKFAKQFAEPLSSSVLPHTNERIPSRKLKIGYISPDFRMHSVGFFIEPVLASHNTKKFKIFVYSDVSQPDEVTKRITGYSEKWRDIVDMSDKEVAELIRKDQIDILIDLSGHTAHNRMLVFARKPAPIQVSWIGYPATTGLSTIDYKIVDSYTDPPGMTDQFYTEKLVRLPDSFLCYLPPACSPDVANLPALALDHITFGSFNNFTKISSEIIEVWIKILMAKPKSHLMIKAKSLSEKSVCDYILGIFRQKGITSDRLQLLPWEASPKKHLSLYSQIDIALDTYPYHGTTTTCEALWMGVPVITLAGKSHISRVGVSLLSNIGLPELIAKTYDEYVTIAVNLACNLEQLQALRQNIRDKMSHSPLIDSQRFIISLENYYRIMWETWCKSTKIAV